MGHNRILKTITNNLQQNVAASIAIENIENIMLFPPLLDVT